MIRYSASQRMTMVWLWAIVSLPVIVCWYAFAQQIVFGIPIGNNPGPDWVVWLVWLLAGVGLPLFIYRLRVTAVVTDTEFRFRLWPFPDKTVLLSDIVKVEPGTYSPIGEYLGWGLRFSIKGNGWAYTISGNQGVRIHLRDGRQYLIGSEEPNQLARALKTDPVSN